MARLWTSGAEAKDATVEGVTVSGVTSDTATVRSGTQSWKCNSGGTGALATITSSFTGAAATNYYARAYVNLPAIPSSPVWLIAFSTGAYACGVEIETDGTLTLRNNTGQLGAQVGSASSALSVNTWYRVELRCKIGTGATDEIELLLDGVSIASSTTQSLTDSALTSLQMGWVNFSPSIPANLIVYMDDIALNDSTGANQTSWPGDGKEVLLVPTSDNSAGSWKAGSAASAVANGALFNAVDNKPPVGTASPNAATAAISNAISGATTPNYDANMTTYAAAGIAAGDTVNLVQQIVVHGEDIATGTKTGTFAMVSNPAIAASASFNFGADVGAAGTYPTNWTVARGAVSYAPSVTLGTAPVARITKTDTGTRAADCCFLGVYVDYTHVVPASLPLRNRVRSNVLLRR